MRKEAFSSFAEVVLLLLLPPPPFLLLFAAGEAAAIAAAAAAAALGLCGPKSSLKSIDSGGGLFV